jgi:hypothetical protein
MASQPQTIVQPAAPVDRPYGSRNEGNIQAAFPTSPLYTDYNDDRLVRMIYQSTVLDGTVTNGLGFPNFNPEYTANGSPNFDNVDTGGEGKPATPYTPNPASPGAGSTNAADQPEFTGTIPDSSPEFGSGLGGLVSPSITSAEIQSQTLGSYGLGKSFAGSNGKQ